MKSTAESQGYKFIRYIGKGTAIFRDAMWGTLEIWQSNPNHASYGFSYNNTDWEFVSEYDYERDRVYND